MLDVRAVEGHGAVLAALLYKISFLFLDENVKYNIRCICESHFQSISN